jgi:hypothetical protein
MLEDFRQSFMPALEFAGRAYAAVEALDEQEYFLRQRDGTKELIEEVLPLAALVKHLETPGRSVSCRHVGGASDHDGEIRMMGREVDQGFWKPQYFVEVTTATFPKEHFRREALARDGSVFMGPEISRVGSRRQGNDRIVSEAMGEDLDAPLLTAISWVRERLMAKNRNSYPRPCLLVVNIEPDRPLSLREWGELAKAVHGSVSATAFERTFIVEWYGNTVFRL